MNLHKETIMSEQKFCEGCGGIKEMKVDGKVVPPEEWGDHGVIGDCGCWCHVQFGTVPKSFGQTA